MDIACLQQLQKTIQSTIQNQAVIDLRNWQLDENSIKVLEKKKTNNAMKVYLSKNKITSIGIQQLSRYKWNSLIHLSLNSNLLKDKGCKYLTKITMHLIKLIALDSNQIGDAGMSHLSKAQWKKLEDGFSITDNKLRNDGIKHFCKANWLKIKRVDLSKNILNKYQARNIILMELNQLIFLNIGRNPLLDCNFEIEQLINTKFSRQGTQFYLLRFGHMKC